MIGQGIQQIPSYKCPIAYDKLAELREHFWMSKNKNRGLWKAIRQCCETDSETAVVLLESFGMSCVEGSLRKVCLISRPDYIFEVPNFCICDPSFDRDYNDLAKKAKDIEEKEIGIVCYYFGKNKDIVLNVRNKMKVSEVKKKFAKKGKVKMDKNVIRFLFKGQEMKDEHLLCYYNVENGSKIHVMVREKD